MFRAPIDSLGLSHLEEMVALLETDGRYGVLRRIMSRPPAAASAGVLTRLGLLLDLETTGLDLTRDEIIEMVMLPFIYELDGTALMVGEPFSKLRQPSQPIPPATAETTRPTDEQVAGHPVVGQL